VPTQNICIVPLEGTHHFEWTGGNDPVVL